MILLATWLVLQTQAKIQLNLDQAVAWARDSSATAKLAASREAEANARKSEATSNLLPTLTASATQMTKSYNFLTGGLSFPGFALPSPIPWYSIQDARLTVQAPLFSAVAWKSLSAAEQGVKARGAEHEAIRDDASLRGGLAWVELSKAQMLERDREEALQLAHDLETMADDQKSSGTATGLDVLRAQAQLVASQRALLQAKLARERASLALARELGVDESDTLVAIGTLSLQAKPLVGGAKPVITPRVRAAQENKEAARLEAEASKARFLPTVGVEADYGYSAGKEQFDGGGNWTGQVGVFAEWSIWGGGDEAKLAQARQKERQASISSSEAGRQAAIDLHDAELAESRSREQLDLAGTQAALVDSELVLSRERFHDGGSGNLEVVQAQGDRNSAHASWIEAAGTHAAALVRLRWAMGLWDGF
jgi:outer membrane protein TolC